MLCPSRKIWICYLKVARSQQTFSWKMGIQYPPRPAGYFDSLLALTDMVQRQLKYEHCIFGICLIAQM